MTLKERNRKLYDDLKTFSNEALLEIKYKLQNECLPMRNKTEWYKDEENDRFVSREIQVNDYSIILMQFEFDSHAFYFNVKEAILDDPKWALHFNKMVG